MMLLRITCRHLQVTASPPLVLRLARSVCWHSASSRSVKVRPCLSLAVVHRARWGHGAQALAGF
jgi:hypothetical protein